MNKENHSDVHNICLESLDYYSDQVMTAVTTGCYCRLSHYILSHSSTTTHQLLSHLHQLQIQDEVLLGVVTRGLPLHPGCMFHQLLLKMVGKC